MYLNGLETRTKRTKFNKRVNAIMQNIKGAIRLFAILMALCCLYYLSFTYATTSHETKAAKFAENVVGSKAIQDLVNAKSGGNETRKKEMLDSVKNEQERFFLEDSMPSKSIWLGNTYMDCKEKEINLGLDLKGGMNVTMEVSVADIIMALSGNNTSPEFKSVMELARERARTSNTDFVTLFAAAFKEKLPNGNMSTFFRSQLKDKITFNATNDQVVDVLRKEANESVDRAKLVLEKRINKFGVAQPNIQKLESSGRILVELPGVKDPKRVRKLLQGTANLEFWRTYENGEVLNYLINANYKLQVMYGITEDSTKGKDSAAVAIADSLKGKPDSAKIYDSLVKLLPKDTSKDAAAKADTSKNKKNPLFDILSPMFDQKNGAFPGPVVGSALQKDTGKVNTLLRMEEIRSIFPGDLRFAWSVKPVKAQSGPDYYQLVALRAEPDGKAALSGDVIVDARKQYDNKNGASPEISMSMNTEGSQAWARITRDNIGKAIAIVLDGYVYTFPTVQGEITGGNSQITGSFTTREADDIVNVLKAGRLPAPARIVEEVVVGPTLGAEAIRAGVLSFLVALIVVLIYMAFYYNKAGLVADFALFVNVFFIMGILSSLGAVLTLPGIAGIVLTIALSVDANILIFERVREELREGKGIALAVADGYKHAMSSILDSNLTTLILGIILYAFGTGPVQGFATTLIIGILSSMFCAIFITRLVFDGMLKRNKDIKFSTPATENILRNTKFDFVGRRKIYYMLSATVIIVGVVFYFQKGGFNLGVDFSGGRNYTVAFTKETGTETVRQTLEAQFPGASLEVKTAGSNNRLKITTNYRIAENGVTVDDEVASKLNEGLTKIAGAGNFKIDSSVKVGPSIANDVVASSYIVIAISCALMFIFILFRFRRWQFGLGAVAALLHDVLVVLSFFVIFDGILPFPLEIDQHFIAAILTVMGYSMTDTVVVFDRIREFLGSKKHEIVGEEKRSMINYALNSTLSRTINTSMITFFVLLAIFIFGGDTIKGFSFALLIGIVIGTYSSLCIATPIVVDFDRKGTLKA
jgi:SecD/SecF fusion protein